MRDPARDTPAVRALREEAARVRETIDSKRSDNMLRLFDFLVERSIEGGAAKEAEVAGAMFAQDYDPAQGATARVYVHRLRKKLDQFYAQRPGPRLHIPLGDYHLTLVDPDGAQAAASATPAPALREPARAERRRWAYAALLGVAVLANGAVALRAAFPGNFVTEPGARDALWKPLAVNARPHIVVVGDQYFFAELDERKNIARIVRDPAINSREDLDVHLMSHLREQGTLMDFDFRHVPIGVTMALQDIWPVLRALSYPPNRPPALVPASRLSADLLKACDIVYVGTFGGLGGMLRAPLFEASGFRIGASTDELVDSRSGRHFTSDASVEADDRNPRTDYGYVASLPGPAGNHILFIAGVREPAVRQMAGLVRNAEQLERLRQRLGNREGAFEALFQVRTLGTLNLDSKLLIARPLQPGPIWNRSQAGPRSPEAVGNGLGAIRSE